MRICLARRQKIVIIANFINVLVTINPVEGVYVMTRTIGEVSLVDGA
ncbi:Single-stranded DNA-binding protein Helix-destabilizing protein [Candidatus Micropelagos thuwalensis]|uniref:Single-stranded DNA-binding protein Helix-destabilizing protein n=1 Tax=Candidatus Micropelagius thuwalensis TaxID=1397666 RepID=U2XQN0_9PROT|nr:Single-stranded DNA-binding protein Helix-destabilizing protein [Candidatus Micropelagos thuwalensis]